MERLREQKKRHNHKRHDEVPAEVAEKPQHSATSDLAEDLDAVEEIVDAALKENQEEFPAIDTRKLGLELMILAARTEKNSWEERISA